MNATDTAALIAEARKTQGYSEGDLKSLVRSLANALEASQARMIRTPEELDALPKGAMIRSECGCVCEKTPSGNWWALNGGVERSLLPATVLLARPVDVDEELPPGPRHPRLPASYRPVA